MKKLICCAVLAACVLTGGTLGAIEPIGLPSSPSLVWTGAAADHVTQARLLSTPQSYFGQFDRRVHAPTCLPMTHCQGPYWSLYSYQPYLGYYQPSIYFTSYDLAVVQYRHDVPWTAQVEAVPTMSDPNRIYSTVPLPASASGPIVLPAPSTLPLDTSKSQ